MKWNCIFFKNLFLSYLSLRHISWLVLCCQCCHNTRKKLDDRTNWPHLVCRVGQKLIHIGQKNCGGTGAFFRRRDHLMRKISIIFYITNSMLNIFITNNFFVKSIFSEETAKNCSSGNPFRGPKWKLTFSLLYVSYFKIKYNPFF